MVQIESINFVDNKINMTQKLKFGLGKVEIIVGKGENAGYQNFYLLFRVTFELGIVLRTRDQGCLN